MLDKLNETVGDREFVLVKLHMLQDDMIDIVIKVLFQFVTFPVIFSFSNAGSKVQWQNFLLIPSGTNCNITLTRK